jgi:hypothetical protein
MIQASRVCDVCTYMSAVLFFGGKLVVAQGSRVSVVWVGWGMKAFWLERYLSILFSVAGYQRGFVPCACCMFIIYLDVDVYMLTGDV